MPLPQSDISRQELCNLLLEHSIKQLQLTQNSQRQLAEIYRSAGDAPLADAHLEAASRLQAALCVLHGIELPDPS